MIWRTALWTMLGAAAVVLALVFLFGLTPAGAQVMHGIQCVGGPRVLDGLPPPDGSAASAVAQSLQTEAATRTGLARFATSEVRWWLSGDHSLILWRRGDFWCQSAPEISPDDWRAIVRAVRGRGI